MISLRPQGFAPERGAFCPFLVTCKRRAAASSAPGGGGAARVAVAGAVLGGRAATPAVERPLPLPRGPRGRDAAGGAGGGEGGWRGEGAGGAAAEAGDEDGMGADELGGGSPATPARPSLRGCSHCRRVAMQFSTFAPRLLPCPLRTPRLPLCVPNRTDAPWPRRRGAGGAGGARPAACAARPAPRGGGVRRRAPPPFVLSGHAASLTPY